MKKNIFHYIGFLNYGCSWLGIIRIILGLSCPFLIYHLLKSEEPLVLRIFGSIILAVSTFGCFVTGIPNLKEGIENRKSYERQLQYDMEFAAKQKEHEK